MTNTEYTGAVAEHDPETYTVGDGVRWGAGTDTNSGTVVGATPAAVLVVEDKATLVNGHRSGAADALTFSPGGFVGHTAGAQRYAFSPGDGPVLRFSYRKRMQCYKLAGTSINGSMRSWGLLSKGRRKHYDYNF
jgi:hypothetical protein